MSYEDNFDREAKDERAYNDFERVYIYENLKPETLGKWEWDLMFNRVSSRSVYSEAAADAAEMARELSIFTTVNEIYPGCWEALPIDYYEKPAGSYWPTYATKRAQFIRDLVLANRYPDMASIADAMDHPDRHSISRHARDEREKHQKWRQEASNS